MVAKMLPDIFFRMFQAKHSGSLEQKEPAVCDWLAVNEMNAAREQAAFRHSHGNLLHDVRFANPARAFDGQHFALFQPHQLAADVFQVIAAPDKTFQIFGIDAAFWQGSFLRVNAVFPSQWT
ncbi:hypothetical protein LDFHOB_04380 [Candidatus Electronema aureum]